MNLLWVCLLQLVLSLEFIDEEPGIPPLFKDIDSSEASKVALTPRAQISPLPPQGVAYTIKSGEIITYRMEKGLQDIKYGLSLSECSKSHPDLPPLNFVSGAYKSSTIDGGLLVIKNFTMFGDTIEIQAPNGNGLPTGEWSFQIGYDASGSFMFSKQEVFWIDSDFSNSLFVTNEYTNFSKLLVGSPYSGFINATDPSTNLEKFQLFLRPSNDSNHPWQKLSKSFCAAKNYALLDQDNSNNSITHRVDKTDTPQLRAQFMFSALNISTNYDLFLGLPPPSNSLGGLLFPATPFHTKQSTACQLLYDVPMCPQIAFSVPGNASLFTIDELRELYNDMVSEYYTNFTRALDQVNCNDTRERMFSVFSNCDTCAHAYRNWLCTVTVPRCADWDNNATYLKERLPGTSRNPFINEKIKPGRYKEILPCNWLCDNLCRYCPTSFEFQCPVGAALAASYGFMSDDGDVTCSYPGAVYTTDSSVRLALKWSWLFIFILSILL